MSTFSAKELANTGQYSVGHANSAYDLLEGPFTAKDLREAGATILQLRDKKTASDKRKFSDREILECGFTVAEIRTSEQYSIVQDILNAGPQAVANMNDPTYDIDQWKFDVVAFFPASQEDDTSVLLDTKWNTLDARHMVKMRPTDQTYGRVNRFEMAERTPRFPIDDNDDDAVKNFGTGSGATFINSCTEDVASTQAVILLDDMDATGTFQNFVDEDNVLKPEKTLQFDGGSGYGSSATVTISEPGSVATASVASDGIGGIAEGYSILRIDVDNGGSGYTTPPNVNITTSGFTPAREAYAEAVVENGVVTSINVLNGGYAYTGTPTITLDAPPDTRPATAIAETKNGRITKISFTDLGSGYVSTPTITISPPTNSTSKSFKKYLQTNSMGRGYSTFLDRIMIHDENASDASASEFAVTQDGWIDGIDFGDDNGDRSANSNRYSHVTLAKMIGHGDTTITLNETLFGNNIPIRIDGDEFTVTGSTGNHKEYTISQPASNTYLLDAVIDVPFSMDTVSNFGLGNTPGSTSMDATVTLTEIKSSGYGYIQSATLDHPNNPTLPSSCSITITSFNGGAGASATGYFRSDGRLQSVSVTNGGSGYPEGIYGPDNPTVAASVNTSASSLYTDSIMGSYGSLLQVEVNSSGSIEKITVLGSMVYYPYAKLIRPETYNLQSGLRVADGAKLIHSGGKLTTIKMDNVGVGVHADAKPFPFPAVQEVTCRAPTKWTQLLKFGGEMYVHSEFGDSATFQWQRTNSSTSTIYTNILGATSSTYTVDGSESKLQVKVTLQDGTTYTSAPITFESPNVYDESNDGVIIVGQPYSGNVLVAEPTGKKVTYTSYTDASTHIHRLRFLGLRDDTDIEEGRYSTLTVTPDQSISIKLPENNYLITTQSTELPSVGDILNFHLDPQEVEGNAEYASKQWVTGTYLRYNANAFAHGRLQTATVTQQFAEIQHPPIVSPTLQTLSHPAIAIHDDEWGDEKDIVVTATYTTGELFGTRNITVDVNTMILKEGMGRVLGLSDGFQYTIVDENTIHLSSFVALPYQYGRDSTNTQKLLLIGKKNAITPLDNDGKFRAVIQHINSYVDTTIATNFTATSNLYDYQFQSVSNLSSPITDDWQLLDNGLYVRRLTNSTSNIEELTQDATYVGYENSYYRNTLEVGDSSLLTVGMKIDLFKYDNGTNQAPESPITITSIYISGSRHYVDLNGNMDSYREGLNTITFKYVIPASTGYMEVRGDVHELTATYVDESATKTTRQFTPVDHTYDIDWHTIQYDNNLYSTGIVDTKTVKFDRTMRWRATQSFMISYTSQDGTIENEATIQVPTELPEDADGIHYALEQDRMHKTYYYPRVFDVTETGFTYFVPGLERREFTVTDGIASFDFEVPAMKTPLNHEILPFKFPATVLDVNGFDVAPYDGNTAEWKDYMADRRATKEGETWTQHPVPLYNMSALFEVIQSATVQNDLGHSLHTAGIDERFRKRGTLRYNDEEVQYNDVDFIMKGTDATSFAQHGGTMTVKNSSLESETFDYASVSNNIFGEVNHHFNHAYPAGSTLKQTFDLPVVSVNGTQIVVHSSDFPASSGILSIAESEDVTFTSSTKNTNDTYTLTLSAPMSNQVTTVTYTAQAYLKTTVEKGTEPTTIDLYNAEGFSSEGRITLGSDSFDYTGLEQSANYFTLTGVTGRATRDYDSTTVESVIQEYINEFAMQPSFTIAGVINATEGDAEIGSDTVEFTKNVNNEYTIKSGTVTRPKIEMDVETSLTSAIEPTDVFNDAANNQIELESVDTNWSKTSARGDKYALRYGDSELTFKDRDDTTLMGVDGSLQVTDDRLPATVRGQLQTATLTNHDDIINGTTSFGVNDTSSLPDSGTVVVGTNIYTYESKTSSSIDGVAADAGNNNWLIRQNFELESAHTFDETTTFGSGGRDSIEIENVSGEWQDSGFFSIPYGGYRWGGEWDNHINVQAGRDYYYYEQKVGNTLVGIGRAFQKSVTNVDGQVVTVSRVDTFNGSVLPDTLVIKDDKITIVDSSTNVMHTFIVTNVQSDDNWNNGFYNYKFTVVGIDIHYKWKYAALQARSYTSMQRMELG